MTYTYIFQLEATSFELMNPAPGNVFCFKMRK